MFRQSGMVPPFGQILGSTKTKALPLLCCPAFVLHTTEYVVLLLRAPVPNDPVLPVPRPVAPASQESALVEVQLIVDFPFGAIVDGVAVTVTEGKRLPLGST